MGMDLPLDGVLPTCRHYILLVPALPVLHRLYVNGGLPPGQQGSLFLLVVGVEEDESVGVEQDGVLEGIPTILLEGFVVTGDHLIVVGAFGFLLTVEAVLADMAHSHYSR